MNAIKWIRSPKTRQNYYLGNGCVGDGVTKTYIFQLAPFVYLFMFFIELLKNSIVIGCKVCAWSIMEAICWVSVAPYSNFANFGSLCAPTNRQITYGWCITHLYWCVEVWGDDREYDVWLQIYLMWYFCSNQSNL